MLSKESNEVAINGILTYEDFKKYTKYHQQKIVVNYFFVSIIVSMAVFSLILPVSLFLLFLVYLPLSLLISGAVTLTFMLMARLLSRREYKSDRAAKSEMSYVINNQGILQKRGKSSTYFEWDDIIKAYENKELFRLYVSKSKAIVLPKRFFSTKDDIESFKSILRENLDTKRVLID
ncbi:YcxB family protein [Lentibacillus sp. CBA3610]|uniref:YcxB family protein n=1 Tax=Lentibacillus sp. CBA3610 TaxID=2518176 RepID=UPI001594F6BD|nr:YcxB family protein [Lentibacillus sp. CBA3610]QKY68864.1 YcxB family protein [Lentibacillus sp. CBA3610]